MHLLFRKYFEATFYEIERIESETAINSSKTNDSNIVIAKRVHPIIYLLVSNNFATLKELRDDYTIYETLDLYEICLATLHNKAEAFKVK